MNEIFERVSTRKFKDLPVEEEKIEQLMRAAMAAPSAGNQQPWEFYLVTDQKTKEKLAASHKYAGCAAGAPLVIVPCYRTEGLKFPDYGPVDVGIATENILLEATSLGLGSVWLGIYPTKERIEAVERILDLPQTLKAFALVPVGYPDENKKQQDRYEEGRIHRL